MERPVIALTIGDAAGVGPELIIKLLTQEETHRRCRPLVVGDAGVIQRACRLLGAGLTVREIGSPAEAAFAPDGIDVLCPPGLDVGAVQLGRMEPRLGEAAARCMRLAFALAGRGAVDGVVLAPMNKQGFHLAGYPYVDELAYLAAETASPEAVSLGAITPALWTVAVTQHLPFREIAANLTAERIVRDIRRLDAVLRTVGVAAPRLAVAALNVHAGEGGLFGREEIEVIEPAVSEARRAGLAVTGPVPADTVFVRARAGEFEGVVCMYHDQANIARKLLATRRGATVYLGLPAPCATTAHGTAYDIAGQGIAAPDSLADALRYTVSLAGGSGVG
ncbi:MAG TPA: 4-hydroxythreonine-4-phosphate dehydrogenase PdxA [Chloroflexota bacterium]|nr:4-hydroxythreonine-4-phosphate dehydrogenase PdxA [Chloroflexota bacterium]